MWIVAEVGSNFRNFDDCMSAISLAKTAGASAVKFQMFTAQELYGTPGAMTNELPREWIPKLASEAGRVGIEFMCTAFSPDGYLFLDPYVKTHKIASAEATDEGILKTVNSLGKPVYWSTGALSEGDMLNAIKLLEDVPVTALYCVAAYPARSTHPGGIPYLKRLMVHKFNGMRQVGLSDHSTEIFTTAWMALHSGASVFEKHFNPLPEGVVTPDSPHSLNVAEFTMMTKLLNAELPYQPISFEEKDMVTTHKRRLIATQDIKAGDTLKANVNYGSYRATREDYEGLSALYLTKINNSICTTDIKAGMPIKPKDIR